MKTKDLRNQSKTELKKRLDKKTSELSELIFDIRVGQESDYAKKLKVRKEVARIKTLLNEKSDEVEKVVEVKTEKKVTKKEEEKKDN